MLTHADLEKAKNTITHKFEFIPPGVARTYLAQRNGNRPLSSTQLGTITGALRRNEFVVDGATIVFDEDGVLADGQHRLQGCISTGLPIVALVVRGVDSEAFKSMDQIKRRSFSDVLYSMRHVKDSNRVSTAVWAYWAIKNGKITHNQRPTHSQSLETFDADPEAFVGYTRKAGAFPWGMPSIYGAILKIIADTNGPDEAEAFHEALLHPEIQELNSGIITFGKVMIKNQSTKSKAAGRLDHRAIGARLIKTYNAWAAHRPLRQLKWAGNEKFPTIQETF